MSISKPLRHVSFFVDDVMTHGECVLFFEQCIRTMYRGFIPDLERLPGWQVEMLDIIINSLGSSSSTQAIRFIGGNTVLSVYTANGDPAQNWMRLPENYTLE